MRDVPEDQWGGFWNSNLQTIRILRGVWRPVQQFRTYHDVRRINALLDAFGRRDAAAARKALDALDKAHAFAPDEATATAPSSRKLSLLVYALYQEAINLGIDVRVPARYDFLAGPDLSRSRDERPERQPGTTLLAGSSWAPTSSEDSTAMHAHWSPCVAAFGAALLFAIAALAPSGTLARIPLTVTK